jgi:hypothetical protein
MSEGEFHFSLTERRDRNGDVYLFVGLKMLNSVLFIRPEPVVAGEPQRWQAILKPYRPKGEQDNYDDPWKQSANDSTASDKQGDRR